MMLVGGSRGFRAGHRSELDGSDGVLGDAQRYYLDLAFRRVRGLAGHGIPSVSVI